MLTNLKTVIASLRRDEKGATAIEYGLLAAFVSIAIIATLRLIGPALNVKFQAILTALT